MMKRFKQNYQKCFCKRENQGGLLKIQLVYIYTTIQSTTPLALHFSNKQTQKHTHIHCPLYKEISLK